MNNLDVSLINVLKNSHPDVFGQYFTEHSSIPNPDPDARREAEAIFRSHSDKDFGQFMKKYRDWVSGRRNTQSDALTQTDPERPCDAVRQRAEEKESENFDILKFLSEKSNAKDYRYLKFQSDDDTFDELNDFDCLSNKNNSHADKYLRQMSEQIKVLNKTFGYRVMDVVDLEKYRDGFLFKRKV